MAGNNLKQIGLAFHAHHDPSTGTLRSNVFAVWLTVGFLRRGLSLQAARQLVAAEVLSSPADRRKLAQLLGVLVDTSPIPLTVTVGGAHTEKVSAIRASLQKLGLSALGAQQLVTGQPLGSAEDRLLLPAVFLAQLTSRRASGQYAGTHALYQDIFIP